MKAIQDIKKVIKFTLKISHQIEMILKRRRFDCKQYLIDCQDVETR